MNENKHTPEPAALINAAWLEKSLTIGAPQAAAELRRLHEVEKQRDELQLIVTNQRQQIAHLNDDLAGTKSNVEFFKKQRDEIQVKANAMAETINAIAGLCTYQHESKGDFIGRVRAVLGDDPDLRVSSIRRERDELLVLLRSIASVAHCGGLVGMTESDALTAIRRATLPHFDTEATEEQHRAAIASVKGGAA